MIKASMPPALANRRNRSWGICLGVLALVLLSIAMVCAVVYSLLNVSTVGRQRELASYLEKKYNEQFVVPEPKYKNGGFAVEGTWSTDFAHPRSNPDLKFHVGCNSYGCSDQYVAAIWSVQANKELAPVVASIYGNDPNVKIRATIILSGDLVKTATKTTPTYDQAKTYEEGFNYEVAINTTNVDKRKLLLDANVAKKLVEYIKSQNIKSLSIVMEAKTIEGKEYLCSAAHSKYGDRIPDDFTTCYREKENR